MTRNPSTRRRSAARGADPNAVADRRARAIEEALDVRLRTRDPYPLLEVRNPLHGTGYLVMLPDFPGRESALCTCTDFARRGLGTCKHIEAGLRWLTDHPEALPLPRRDRGGPRTAGLWKKIDQRESALSRDPAPPGVRWRRPGALLVDSGTKE